MPNSLKKSHNLSRITHIFLDVDGVLTDGKITYIGNEELKSFSVYDGTGIKRAKEAGIVVAVISGRSSAANKRRFTELGIEHVYEDVSSKITIYEELKSKFHIKDECILYMGDDIQDLEVLKEAGIAVAPANAMRQAKAVCDIVTVKKGGHGAVREIIDMILNTVN